MKYQHKQWLYAFIGSAVLVAWIPPIRTLFFKIMGIVGGGK